MIKYIFSIIFYRKMKYLYENSFQNYFIDLIVIYTIINEIISRNIISFMKCFSFFINNNYSLHSLNIFLILYHIIIFIFC